MAMLDRASVHFLKIAESGNLARAAQALGIGQPALSRSLQGLESRLGARLFERTARGMALTAIGEVLHERLAEAQQSLADTEAEIGHLASGAIGRVRVGVGHVVAARVRDALFPRLLQDRPAAKIELHEAFNVELFERVARGTLDFAVCGVAAKVPRPLTCSTLVEEQMVALVRRDHPLTTLQGLRMEQLRGYRYASASGILPGSPLADPRLREFGGNEVEQTLTTNSMTTLLEAVARTDMFAIGAWDEALRRRWGDQIVPLPILNEAFRSVIGLVYRHHRQLSPLAEHVVYLIEQALRPAPVQAAAADARPR